jgi:hypothetical protein
MNVSIMQPYLFPHIGYFQLMASADVFVVHDDVQYIKSGWINRNRILSNGEPRWVTLPVAAAAHRLNINQRRYARGSERPRQFLRRLEAAYHAAPNSAEVLALVSALLFHEDRNVAAFNTHALRGIAEAIGITTPLVVSSEMTKDGSLKGEARVIAMCEVLGAETYVNPIGGTALYHQACFAEHGLELAFLQSDPRAYQQFGPVSVPGLSIIDVLMFNDAATVREMLEEFTLVGR